MKSTDPRTAVFSQSTNGSSMHGAVEQSVLLTVLRSRPAPFSKVTYAGGFLVWAALLAAGAFLPSEDFFLSGLGERLSRYLYYLLESSEGVVLLVAIGAFAMLVLCAYATIDGHRSIGFVRCEARTVSNALRFFFATTSVYAASEAAGLEPGPEALFIISACVFRARHPKKALRCFGVALLVVFVYLGLIASENAEAMIPAVLMLWLEMICAFAGAVFADEISLSGFLQNPEKPSAPRGSANDREMVNSFDEAFCKAIPEGYAAYAQRRRDAAAKERAREAADRKTSCRILTVAVPLAFLIVFALNPPHALDVAVSGWFYNGSAWPLHGNFFFTQILHKAAKVPPILIGLAALWIMAKSTFAVRSSRLLGDNLLADGYRFEFRRAAYVVIAMLASVLVVWWFKSTTGVACPWDTVAFNGDKAIVNPSFSLLFRDGNCWPAGHAGSGFCLFAMYFASKATDIRRGSARNPRTAGLLLFALLYGWICGFARIAQGAHFLSHTIATMLVDWIVCAVLYILFERFFSVGSSPET